MATTRPALQRPFLRAEAAALRRLERRARTEFDAVVVVSGGDAAALPGAGGSVLVCPNGVEAAAALPPARAPLAVFVALLSWGPNADAARWLGTDIWPAVQARCPGARLRLVGRDPAQDLRALRANGVEVTGTVPSVIEHLAEARVALAPLRAGGGTKLKVLEAMGAGRPVVATSVGASGLDDLRGEGLVVADGTEPFAAAVADLLDDPAGAAELGARASAAVRDRYTWDRTLAPLLDAVGRP